MQTASIFATSFVAAAVVLSSHVAHAEEALATPTRDASALHLSGQLGGYTSANGGGALTGLTVLVRTGAFEAGVQGQAGTGLTSYDYLSLGGLAGVVLTPTAHWRLDLLGQVGVDAYDHFDAKGGLLSGDPGGSATLPYAGLRASVSHRFRTFELGIGADYANDLGRSSAQYTYTSTSWFGGPESPTATSRSVGTDRLALMISFGAAFDL